MNARAGGIGGFGAFIIACPPIQVAIRFVIAIVMGGHDGSDRSDSKSRPKVDRETVLA